MMTTTADTQQSPETLDVPRHDHTLNDESLVQEWRDRRAAAFRRSQRIDRIGNVVGAVLAALLLSAVLHACHCF